MQMAPNDGRMIEAVNPSSILSAGIAHGHGLHEMLKAPRFKWAVSNVGPVEHLRSEYVGMRDELQTCERNLRLLRWANRSRMLKLRAAMAAIPLEEKWSSNGGNTVVTAGANDLMTQYFKGSAYTAAWYMLLVDNASFSAIAATDTIASHSGWLESTAYSNSTRVALSFGTASARALAASAASFSINATAIINGAGIVNNSTKGGTTGTLYSAGSFGATRSVLNGDTLNVTPTVSC